jgi:hypothetical protein
MTESDRHANTISRIKVLLRELQASVWENDHERLEPRQFRGKVAHE